VALLMLLTSSVPVSLGFVPAEGLVAGGFTVGAVLLLISRRGIYDIEPIGHGLVLPVANPLGALLGKPHIIPWDRIRGVAMVGGGTSTRVRVSLAAKHGKTNHLTYPVKWIRDLEKFESAVRSVLESREQTGRVGD